MDYRTLVNEWKKYPRRWDQSYMRCVHSGIWSLPTSKIEKKIQFFNDWLCRVDKKTAIPQLKEHSQRFGELIQEISALTFLSLALSLASQLGQVGSKQVDCCVRGMLIFFLIMVLLVMLEHTPSRQLPIK